MRTSPFIRIGLTLALALAVILTAGCTGGAESKISLSTLTIAPEEAEYGQSVAIGINILNSGKNAEEYSAALKINDVIVETRQISVGAGETQTLGFEYTPKEKGNYSVDINGQSGSFSVYNPAAFKVENLVITPEKPVVGGTLEASVKVINSGDVSGEYRAALLIDGLEAKAHNLTVEAGAESSAVFNVALENPGSHTLSVGELRQDILVLKPAEYKAAPVQVSRSSVLPGEAVSIETTVTNEGEVEEECRIEMNVNGSPADNCTVKLAAGASEKVQFSYASETPGYYSIEVLGSSAVVNVVGFSEYTSSAYGFTLDYPPQYTVDDEDPGSVFIQNSAGDGLSVWVENVSTESTSADYLESIKEQNQDYYTNWVMKSQTALKGEPEINGVAIVNGSDSQNGSGFAYRYDFTYSNYSGAKYQGQGLVFKSAGLGYNIEYTLKAEDYEKYAVAVDQCIASFKPAPSFCGSYSSVEAGLALSLPSGWSALETGIPSQPVIFFTPIENPLMYCALTIDAVVSTTPVSDFIDTIASVLINQGWSAASGKTFSFTDGSVGYEKTPYITVTPDFKVICRLIGQAKDGRAVTLIFEGDSVTMNNLAADITECARSLQLSKGGGVSGVDRSEAVFLQDFEIPTLDPALVETGPGGIVGAVFSGLVRFDTDLKIAPDLAESWQVNEDGRVYTFKLRQNAVFHDGRRVTAEDVRYSWERACDPALESVKARSFLSDIEGADEMLAGTAQSLSGVKVVDDYTLEVRLKAARAYFLGEIAQPVAFVVDKNNVVKGSQWYEEPNGTGAFKIERWNQDSLLVLERNDDFYLEPAGVKYLVFKLYAGHPLQLYQNGEIDIAQVSTDNQDTVMDPTNALNQELVTGYEYNNGYLAFNVSKAPFDDVKIRQALACALDIPKLIEVTLKGESEIASGFVPPGIPGYNPDREPVALDLERAKQLIAESKYGSIAGVPTITVYSVYAVTPLEQAVIGMWQALGLKVNSQVITSVEEYQEGVHNRNYQVYFSGWRADYIDPQNFLEILFQSESPDNGFGYNNLEVDAALAAAAVEQDEKTRIKMYQDIEELILADLPGVPLYWKSKTMMLVKPYVQGYAAYPIDINLWRDLSITEH